LSALHGAIAVAAGAMASHAISDPGAVELIDTGARWQVASALAGLVSALFAARIAAALHVFGALAFAGALYGLAFGAPDWLAHVAPVGGLSMIAGWLALAVALVTRR
jgi:uncharacterized membrane protein YgdD (TMEM256/DUF423 family)